MEDEVFVLVLTVPRQLSDNLYLLHVFVLILETLETVKLKIIFKFLKVLRPEDSTISSFQEWLIK